MFLLTGLILLLNVNLAVLADDGISDLFNPEILGQVVNEIKKYNLTNNYGLLKDEHELDPFSILKTPKFVLEKLQNYKSSNTSRQCVVDFMSFALGLVKRETWALKMFDAYGKVGSGISEGNFVWAGRFSLCNSITHDPPVSAEKPFRGQYCWIFISPTDKAPIPPEYRSFLKLRTAACVPSSCSPDDLSDLIKQLNSIPIVKTYAAISSNCIPATRDIWSDYRAIICLVFCFIIVAIIFGGTAYDVYLQWYTCTTNSQNSKRLPLPAPKSQDIVARKDGVEMEKQISSKDSGVMSSADAKPQDEITQEEGIVNEKQASAIRTVDELHLLDEKKKEPNMFGKVLLCFSFYTNGEKLFNTVPRDNSLMCLNGIRVFSMLWVILAHCYLGGAGTLDNLFVVMEWTKEFSFLCISQGQFAVDTFLVLSGLLVTYLYLKEHEKRNGNISWFKFYFHRYWRLTPVFAVTLFLFYNILSPYYMNSPFWPQGGLGGDNCDKYWWTNLLYGNNFLANRLNCMGHTWYLAIDMQFYVISPLILIFLTRNLQVSAIIAFVLMLVSWTATGVISKFYNILPTMTEGTEKYFDYIYDKPYCRIAPYIIGMICGYLLYRFKCQHRLNKVVVVLGWLLSAVISYLVMFSAYHFVMSQDMQRVYHSLSRSAWALAVAWMIYACCNGYGGIVNKFLSWPFWQPFGRLTYSSYLIHSAIIPLFIQGMEVPLHFSHYAIWSIFGISATASYFVAVFISLAFEAPFMNLEKLFL